MKINATFNIDPKHLTTFETAFRGAVDVLDFRVVPDTTELYENDPHFKALSKAVKDAKKLRDIYWNDHRVLETK